MAKARKATPSAMALPMPTWLLDYGSEAPSCLRFSSRILGTSIREPVASVLDSYTLSPGPSFVRRQSALAAKLLLRARRPRRRRHLKSLYPRKRSPRCQVNFRERRDRPRNHRGHKRSAGICFAPIHIKKTIELASLGHLNSGNFPDRSQKIAEQELVVCSCDYHFRLVHQTLPSYGIGALSLTVQLKLRPHPPKSITY